MRRSRTCACRGCREGDTTDQSSGRSQADSREPPAGRMEKRRARARRWSRSRVLAAAAGSRSPTPGVPDVVMVAGRGLARRAVEAARNTDPERERSEPCAAGCGFAGVVLRHTPGGGRFVAVLIGQPCPPRRSAGHRAGASVPGLPDSARGASPRPAAWRSGAPVRERWSRSRVLAAAAGSRSPATLAALGTRRYQRLRPAAWRSGAPVRERWSRSRVLAAAAGSRSPATLTALGTRTRTQRASCADRQLRRTGHRLGQRDDRSSRSDSPLRKARLRSGCARLGSRPPPRGPGSRPAAWRSGAPRARTPAQEPSARSLFYCFSIRTVFSSTRSTGASPLRATPSMASTTSMPATTRPKAV